MIKVHIIENVTVSDLKFFIYKGIDEVNFLYKGDILSISHAFNTDQYRYSIVITYKIKPK